MDFRRLIINFVCFVAKIILTNLKPLNQLKISDFRFKEFFHFYLIQRSDMRRKRLRCASDFHKSKIINLQSTIPKTGLSGLGE